MSWPRDKTHAVVEAYRDRRIMQHFVLQPRVDSTFSVQDVPELANGSGLSDLRLRHERWREIALCAGV